MDGLVLPALAYAVVMIFTPGPNNISASSLGMRTGYRGSVPYFLGMTAGFFTILLFSGLLTDFLTTNYGRFAHYLKWIGAGYIAYLALSLFIHRRGEATRPKGLNEGFLGGLVLQFVNPKGVLFGITTYVSFSSLLTGSLWKTLASAGVLAMIGFAAVSTWAVVGAGLSRMLTKKLYRTLFDVVMALLLLYSAVSILLH
jgi:cysteine/O-acetylserine efflux protein